jgi:predicted amidohydrolase YtcJ
MGLTGAHTIETRAMAEVLDQACRDGRVSIDLFRMREVLEPEEIDGLTPSSRLECIKTYADGTLGSQTASMLEAFSGDPGNFGIPYAPKQKLREIAFRAAAKGFAVSIHAIGDRANREVLDIYEELRASGRGSDALLRVEHAQVLSPQDIPRFGRLRVVASMQPVHLVSDRPVAERYWGARARTAYAWKKIMTQGGTVAFGSDAPIEGADPLKGIHAAVTRSDPARLDLGAWFPEERLEAWQAVDCYTAGAAAASGRGAQGRAARDEGAQAGAARSGGGQVGVARGRASSGTIEVGSRPCLTVLDTDIVSAADPDAILGARVVATVVDGEFPAFT